MKTNVPDKLIDEIKRQQRLKMGNLVDLRRQEPLAPGVEESGIVSRGLPARISAGYGTFRDVADRFSGVTPYTITVEVGADVRPGDRWIDEEGRVFNIMDVRLTGTFHTATVSLCDWVH